MALVPFLDFCNIIAPGSDSLSLLCLVSGQRHLVDYADVRIMAVAYQGSRQTDFVIRSYTSQVWITRK